MEMSALISRSRVNGISLCDVDVLLGSSWVRLRKLKSHSLAACCEAAAFFCLVLFLFSFIQLH